MPTLCQVPGPPAAGRPDPPSPARGMGGRVPSTAPALGPRALGLYSHRGLGSRAAELLSRGPSGVKSPSEHHGNLGGGRLRRGGGGRVERPFILEHCRRRPQDCSVRGSSANMWRTSPSTCPCPRQQRPRLSAAPPPPGLQGWRPRGLPAQAFREPLLHQELFFHI